MRFTTRSVAAIAAVGALALGVPALAQDDADVPTDDEQVDRPPAAARGQRLAEALAEELGLETDEVAAALEAVHDRFRAERREAMLERLTDRLAAAVDEGDLTQEQADAILEAAENGVFPRLGQHDPRHRGPRGFHRAGPGAPPGGTDAA